jgi:hypothetical protein
VLQQVLAMIDEVRMLSDADAEAKSALYAALGIRLTYDPHKRTVIVEAQPGPWAHNVPEGRLHP